MAVTGGTLQRKVRIIGVPLDLGGETKACDIDVALALDEGLPRVRGDHERLRQLLINLLFNAADALGGKGRIELRASNGEGTVQLTVEDDGEGYMKIVAKLEELKVI